MSALFLVEKCPDLEVPPGPNMRNAKHNVDDKDTYEDDYDYNYNFNVISFNPKKPKPQARSSRGATAQVWTHYIAIEEIAWDYTPHLQPTDRSG